MFSMHKVLRASRSGQHSGGAYSYWIGRSGGRRKALFPSDFSFWYLLFLQSMASDCGGGIQLCSARTSYFELCDLVNAQGGP